jgi:multiple sugar transport system substrate-binding protein
MNTVKFSRRDFLKVAGLATGSVVLAACAQQATPTKVPEPTKAPAAGEPTKAPAAKSPVTLTTNTQYWNPQQWPQSAALYRQLLKESGFEWLTINHEAADATTLETRMAAGDAPDILFVYPELAIPWAARKQLVPLTDKINADAEWKRDVEACIPSMNEGYMWKGQLYAVTIAAEAECYSYNPKQFEKKGVKKPSEIGKDAFTIEKFAEITQALTDGPNDKPLGEKPAKGWIGGDLGYNTGFGDLLYANGGKYFSEDGKKALLNSKEFVETAAFVSKLVKDGWAANAIELTAQGEWHCLALANMRGASVIAGDWCWGWVHKTQLERKEFEPEMFFVPSGSAGRHPLAHSAGESIYARTKNLDAALAYVKFAFTKKYQEATATTYEEAPRYPARHDAAGPILQKKLLPDFFPDLFKDSWASPTTPMINFMGILGYWGDTMKGVLAGTDTRPLQTVFDELNARTQKDMDAAGAGLDI